MKHTLFVVLMALSLSANAFDRIDHQCLSQCLEDGHMMGWCRKVCSY